MKHFLLTALTIALTAPTVHAQVYEYSPQPIRQLNNNNFRVGAYIAPTVSWMKPTASKSNDNLYLVDADGSKVGFAWGLMLDYYFAPNYGIATGIQLNTSGGRINVTQNPAEPQTGITNIIRSAEFDYRLQYLEIPFALKLRSDEISSGVRAFGQMGLTAGFNISKKATYDVVYTGINNVDSSASGENERLRGGLGITPFLLQLNVGAGIEYAITPKMSIYTGLFFNNGFAPDVTNPKEFDNMNYRGKFTDGNVRLNNFALRLGLFF